jgi:hypothetical protein
MGRCDAFIIKAFLKKTLEMPPKRVVSDTSSALCEGLCVMPMVGAVNLGIVKVVAEKFELQNNCNNLHRGTYGVLKNKKFWTYLPFSVVVVLVSSMMWIFCSCKIMCRKCSLQKSKDSFEDKILRTFECLRKRYSYFGNSNPMEDVVVMKIIH